MPISQHETVGVDSWTQSAGLRGQPRGSLMDEQNGDKTGGRCAEGAGEAFSDESIKCALYNGAENSGVALPRLISTTPPSSLAEVELTSKDLADIFLSPQPIIIIITTTVQNLVLPRRGRCSPVSRRGSAENERLGLPPALKYLSRPVWWRTRAEPTLQSGRAAVMSNNFLHFSFSPLG